MTLTPMTRITDGATAVTSLTFLNPLLYKGNFLNKEICSEVLLNKIYNTDVFNKSAFVWNVLLISGKLTTTNGTWPPLG